MAEDLKALRAKIKAHKFDHTEYVTLPSLVRRNPETGRLMVCEKPENLNAKAQSC